jgi:TolA-binding protein
MSEGQRLAQYVGRDRTEQELSEQWEHVESRLGQKPARRVLPIAAVAAVAAVALASVLFVVHRRSVPSAWDGAVLDSGADHVSVALGDGSRIELMPASQVRVVEGSARSVRLDLHKGSARFDVTHVAGRGFSVKSGKVTIRVVGTRFSVTRALVPEGERVTVAVEEGVVEAESASGASGAETTRIHAGETWTTIERAEPPPAPSMTDAPVALKVAPEKAVARAGTAPAAAERAAPAEHASAATVEHAPAGDAPGKAEPTAAELFESANAARRAGDARAAAAAYEAMLHHHPGDSRAGLAAFELGRLKMDQLGDTRGAIVALQRAVAAAPSSAFREDALARLARAYGTLGRRESCERTRSTYLESYPNGVHAAAVRQACGGSP